MVKNDHMSSQRSGAEKIASCEAKPTAKLLSLPRSWYRALNRAMQSLQRSLEMSPQELEDSSQSSY